MRVRRVNVVFEFNIDRDIILSIGTKIKSIQKNFNAKIQMLNVPTAVPPDAPRLIIVIENFVINVSLNRFEYAVEIPPHINSNINSSLNYVSAKIENIYKYLVVDNDSYNWSGVVATLEFPSKDKNKSIDLMVPIFDRIIGIDRRGHDLASFQLQFGFHEEGIFRNFTLSGYETFNLQLVNPNNSDIVLFENKLDSEIIESGISVIVDINNRPQKNHNDAFSEFEKILSDLQSAVKDIPNILNLGGIVNE